MMTPSRKRESQPVRQFHAQGVRPNAFLWQMTTVTSASSGRVLVRYGYHVDAAEDGVAAWEALQIKAFNLLITDHDMPRLTGVELVKKLRSARMALPVILVTGKLPAEELVQNPSLQLAAVLPKPFSIVKLLETVRVVLRATDGTPEQFEPLPDRRSQPSAGGFGFDDSNPRPASG